MELILMREGMVCFDDVTPFWGWVQKAVMHCLYIKGLARKIPQLVTWVFYFSCSHLGMSRCLWSFPFSITRLCFARREERKEFAEWQWAHWFLISLFLQPTSWPGNTDLLNKWRRFFPNGIFLKQLEYLEQYLQK